MKKRVRKQEKEKSQIKMTYSSKLTSKSCNLGLSPGFSGSCRMIHNKIDNEKTNDISSSYVSGMVDTFLGKRSSILNLNMRVKTNHIVSPKETTLL